MYDCMFNCSAGDGKVVLGVVWTAVTAAGEAVVAVAAASGEAPTVTAVLWKGRHGCAAAEERPLQLLLLLRRSRRSRGCC